MTTKSDLQLICNYIESSKPSMSNGVINYLEFVGSDSEESKLAIKKENRNLAIDAILGGEEEEYKFNKSNRLMDLSMDKSYVNSISTQMKSINVRSTKYNTIDNIWIDVLTKIEYLTSTNKKTQIGNLDINLSNDPNLTKQENFISNQGRILSRISSLNGIIAMSSIGPATTIICGYKSVEYIASSSMLSNQSIPTMTKSIGSINGMSVIVSNLIKDNKIILLRASIRTDIGINVINNINDNTYFMIETPNSWDRVFAWFDII